jgi:hypothetical protein
MAVTPEDNEQNNRLSAVEVRVEMLQEKVADLTKELGDVKKVLLIGFMAILGMDISGMVM